MSDLLDVKPDGRYRATAWYDPTRRVCHGDTLKCRRRKYITRSSHSADIGNP